MAKQKKVSQEGRRDGCRAEEANISALGQSFRRGPWKTFRNHLAIYVPKYSSKVEDHLIYVQKEGSEVRSTWIEISVPSVSNCVNLDTLT